MHIVYGRYTKCYLILKHTLKKVVKVHLFVVNLVPKCVYFQKPLCSPYHIVTNKVLI